MYKLILQDYRTHWRSALKKMYNQSTIVFVWLMVTLSHIDTSSTRDLPFVCLACCCYISFFLARMYGGYINRTLYLCPLSADMRKRYIKESIQLRIIIPLVLCLTGNIIFLFANITSLLYFILQFFVFMCTAISVNIHCPPLSPEHIPGQDDCPIVGNYIVWNTYSHITNIINIMMMEYIMDHQPLSYESWIVICTLLVLQLFTCLMKIKKYYWQVVVLAAFYN